VTPGVLWIVGSVGPCVQPARARMADQIEYLYNPFPYRPALECLFDWDTRNVRRIDTMEASDHVAEFINMAHAAVLTRSATLQ
jgi:hypothetical protein